MEKHKVTKLVLNKETVAALDDLQKEAIQGGTASIGDSKPCPDRSAYNPTSCYDTLCVW